MFLILKQEKVKDYPWVETQVNSALGHINGNKGPKRVTDALIGLIDKSEGRIVNISSGSASMWLRYQDSTTKKLFTNPDISFEDLEAKGGLISESFSLSKFRQKTTSILENKVL